MIYYLVDYLISPVGIVYSMVAYDPPITFPLSLYIIDDHSFFLFSSFPSSNQVTSKYQVKISDFELSRRTVYHVKHTELPLPL